jgi:hypothetical protein
MPTPGRPAEPRGLPALRPEPCDHAGSARSALATWRSAPRADARTGSRSARSWLAVALAGGLAAAELEGGGAQPDVLVSNGHGPIGRIDCVRHATR